MLSQVRAEMLALASRTSIEARSAQQGWNITRWQMSDEDVEAAVLIYNALLLGGASESILSVLADAGLDIASIVEGEGKDDVTRSDITELIAAASLIGHDGLEIDKMHMPNVPKMSRRKSDSGIDITAVEMEEVGLDVELSSEEWLTIASVKHTVDTTTSGMRYKLDKSVDDDLTPPYLYSQLRVVNGQLTDGGMDPSTAERIYLFMRDYPALSSVRIFAVGVASLDLIDDFEEDLRLLSTTSRQKDFRMILVDGLRTLHERSV